MIFSCNPHWIEEICDTPANYWPAGTPKAERDACPRETPQASKTPRRLPDRPRKASALRFNQRL
ncbi:hypothetical protein ABWK46_04970 [Peribacillus frigoritolerans]